MPIRIYALAKDLKIDSKELVDLCAKAGITGKGSALASLTDEELDRVKAFLKVGGRVEPSAPIPPTPSPVVAAPIPPKPIEPPRPAPPRPAPPAAPPTPTPTTPAAAAPPQTPGFSRESYIPPGGMVGGKPRVITGKPSAKPPLDIRRERDGGGSRDAGSRPSQRRDPVFRVAAIPPSGHTPAQAKSNEPAPQKPIMTLPVDAIRNAKSGSRAPLEQFTKQQDKKREGERTERDRPPREGHREHGRDRDTSPRGPAPNRGVVPPVLTEEEIAAKAARERRRVKEAEPTEIDGDRDKKLAAMAGSRSARQQKRRRVTSAAGVEEEEVEVRRKKRRLTRLGTNTAAPRKGKVFVDLPCTVRSLSEATGVPTSQIQRALLQLGSMVAINQELDQELAELVASDLGMEVDFRSVASLEDQLVERFRALSDSPEDLEVRPPVVTFLGHVDHGKTSLLDRIIGINVVSGEAGGITQHIRAYKISKGGREIAFVDTPGHEAFTEMRARGAHVTDIAVLVVAADDGVMPQTEEALSHARAAEVPIVVAMNKCDLPGADPQRVLQQLSAQGLLPVEWGGEVEVVRTSAVTGEGIDTLLETLLLTADIHDYRANPARPASGTCLEAEQQGNQGVMAKLIVQNGTLSVGDIIVCGGAYGRIKAMYDTLKPRVRIQSAGPSTPVNVTGMDIAPGAGDPFFQMTDIAEARQIAEKRLALSRSRSLSKRTVRVSFDEFQKRLEEGRLGADAEVATLNLIIRADVRGSIEAIQKELDKLQHPEVAVRVLQATVGGVTSADVTLADASNAVIVGFNVIPDEVARALAEERGVEIRRYDIIYKVTEDIRALLEGKLKPESKVLELGRALVQRTFTISRVGTVAGCRVLSGTIERNCRIRVNRNGRGIGEYALDSLKREKDDAREVREGFECGIKLTNFNDLKEGDILEAFKLEEVARTL